MLTETTLEPLRAGDSAVPLRGWTHAPAKLLFVNLHQNETTSVEAALQVLTHMPGDLMHFAAGTTRTLEGSLGGQTFAFDPNRVFSEAGIAATLRKHNGREIAGAGEALGRFADAYARVLRLRTYVRVIAIHNTGDDYNVHAYEPGGEEAPGAAAVYVSPRQHHHDFFFVTERAVFDVLRERDYNVVLQAASPPDDGSLSVRCARLGVPYVNVEARYHLPDNQARMLRELYTLPSPVL